MKLVQLEETIIAGILVHATWKQLWQEAPKAWHSVFEHHQRPAPGRRYVDASLGIVDAAYLQLVGFEVATASEAPDGFKVVRIPAQRMLQHQHRGPVTRIAESFGSMYEWGKRRELALGEFKLDFGYTANGEEPEHDLYVGLDPETPWQYSHGASWS